VKIFGLPETYLQKVKEIQTREFEVSQKENGFWLNRIVYDTRNDLDFGEILATPERIKALTMDDLRRMLQTLVQEDRWVRVTLYPEEGN
jgi:zinc protease